MKKLIIACLLLTNICFSQTSEKKVWNLLLANKREQARSLFDKELKSKVESNVDYLILDGILDYEQGKSTFDDALLKKFLNVCKQKEYLYPIWYLPFVLDNANRNGYTDYTYSKIDLIDANLVFNKEPIVTYFKAICDRKRKNIESFNSNISKLDAIEDWQYCGVFENLNDSGLETEYEPEIYANNDKIFNANSNGKVGWYNPVNKQKEGYHFFTNESEYGNGIAYSQVFIESPSDRQVVMNFGVSSSIKFFVNDVEIYANNMSISSDLNAYKLKFNLKKGTNRLLVKLALKNGSDYFFVSLRDINNNSFSDLKYFDSYKPYIKSTAEQVNAVELNTDFEDYFANLISKNPDSFLYKFMLFNAYSNNNKNELATDIVEGLIKQYPNSSLVQVMQMTNYSAKNEEQKVEEIFKNMEINDPSYFYTILKKVQDKEWLKVANINDIEKYSEKASLLKSKDISILYQFIIASRKGDKNAMIEKIDELTIKSNNNEFYVTSFSNLYEKLKNDKAKAIDILEKLTSKIENATASNILKNYYEEADRKQDVEKIVRDFSSRYEYSNGLRKDYISNLINNKKYDLALIEIDKGLANFPYSYDLMQKKGQVYNYQNNVKEAAKYFRQSLVHNSENNAIRTQLYDITKTPDEIEVVATADIYKVIKERRNTTLKGDYGVTLLLDEYIVNELPESGRKSKVTYLYEITSEKGIEEMKEHSISTQSNRIIKSEIVKPDGSIVPGEQGDGTIVFTNLKVGDVVFIQYERSENATGRFYKDFDLACNFNGQYPEVEVIFAVITPIGTEFLIDYNNGKVPFTTKKIIDKNCTIWKKNNVPSLPLSESYATEYSDSNNTVRIGTIKSWKEISNWYSDLVKKNLKIDKITKNTFDEIFPKGITAFSQEIIAKKIYTYIETNINYSSLDFRQSGFVPQKPSKTITTKLGDCKDVSTLFVALSQLAGLKSNLVLVSTNDNGFSSMPLPSNNFNHCIVKTVLDGKEYFLELTNKYLPFKALPNSLYKANALVISFDKAENETSKIIAIPFDNAPKNKLSTTSIITIDDKSKDFTNTISVTGANKAYYNELFSTATTDDIRKKSIEDDYNERLKKNIALQSSKIIKNELFENEITFETKFTISERLQSVGSLKITDIPFLDKAYTKEIIALESRKYDIEYFKYETNNEYLSEVVINVPIDKKIIEVPENKTFSYKAHKYEVSFELLKNNSLKIKRKVTLNWDKILPVDYLNYKKYVDDVITTEEQIIGFK